MNQGGSPLTSTTTTTTTWSRLPPPSSPLPPSPVLPSLLSNNVWVVVESTPKHEWPTPHGAPQPSPTSPLFQVDPFSVWQSSTSPTVHNASGWDCGSFPDFHPGPKPCWSVQPHQDQVGTDEGDEYNWWFLLVIVFLLAGGLGNVLVCLAICLERRLQNMTNYFLLSLAVADLLVSLVVMPFGLVIGFTGYWPFGAAMCNVYVTCDVLACSSSILHMCFISIGRYVGIRNPLKTRRNSKKMVVLKIVLVWLLAMVITSPITILGLTDFNNILPEPHFCTISNRFFFIFGSLFAFYIPMVFMVVSYVLTVQLLKKQAEFGEAPHTRRIHVAKRHKSRSPEWGHQHSSNHQQYSFRSTGSGRSSSSSSADTGYSFGTSSTNQNTIGGSNGNSNGHVYSGQSQYSASRHSQPHGHYHSRRSSSVCDKGTQTSSSRASSASSAKELLGPLRRFHHQQTVAGRKSSRNQFDDSRSEDDSSIHFKFLPSRSYRSSKGSTSVANEQKATKVLGVVFFTFVICWTPFFLLNIIFAACPQCEVSDRIVSTCLWLGYVSSTINPIIYTIFNRTFKEAFIKLLTCRCVFRRKQVRAFSATDSLAHTPIKIIGCIRTTSLPPAFDGQDSVSVSVC